MEIQENDKNAVELPILRAMKYSFKTPPEFLTSFLKQKERLRKENHTRTMDLVSPPP
jgi:hypothetical protein